MDRLILSQSNCFSHRNPPGECQNEPSHIPLEHLGGLAERGQVDTTEGREGTRPGGAQCVSRAAEAGPALIVQQPAAGLPLYLHTELCANMSYNFL